ncbi:tripartite tricarboxylate transporter TctB family protein [Ruegeria sp.]|uniref:tripartite tricarboxylate transporter TctB family protein n=1 Tax=Ruegeria sp. TaxID=1879320 RepID=UPI00231C9A47|nr:tripartite tricarboxylate transporter TctB family protein [Ruegeria sp.]MDA7966027.1 tripartite tricarboxylate transporter TctB family protein [Ruegeria sp.]
MPFNKDIWTSLALLAFCFVMIAASFDVVSPDFGMLSPTAWPRAVLALLTLLSLIYFVNSVRSGQRGSAFSLKAFLIKYRNPICCFIAYFVFLITLPLLGILIGGILLVFVMLTILGENDIRHLVLHAVIATVSISILWCIFTFALNVRLPRGSILPAMF